jgi:hypothetical protein
MPNFVISNSLDHKAVAENWVLRVESDEVALNTSFPAQDVLVR